MDIFRYMKAIDKLLHGTAEGGGGHLRTPDVQRSLRPGENVVVDQQLEHFPFASFRILGKALLQAARRQLDRLQLFFRFDHPGSPALLLETPAMVQVKVARLGDGRRDCFLLNWYIFVQGKPAQVLRFKQAGEGHVGRGEDLFSDGIGIGTDRMSDQALHDPRQGIKLERGPFKQPVGNTVSREYLQKNGCVQLIIGEYKPYLPAADALPAEFQDMPGYGGDLAVPVFRLDQLDGRGCLEQTVFLVVVENELGQREESAI